MIGVLVWNIVLIAFVTRFRVRRLPGRSAEIYAKRIVRRDTRRDALKLTLTMVIA